MKKAGLTALAIIVTLATASSAEANYHYRHGHCGYALRYDYSHANFLSPASYIFPVANWGSFFQCHMYYSPAVYLPGYDP